MTRPYKRRKEEIESEYHAQKNRSGKAGEFEKAIADGAWGDEQETQHHPHTQLRKEKKEGR